MAPHSAGNDFEFDTIDGGAAGTGRLIRLTPRPDGSPVPPIDYEIDFAPLVRELGRNLTADLADLLAVAFIVTRMDRFSPRSDARGRRSRSANARRNLRGRIAVRDPERWRWASESGVLGDYLGFLSDDDWSFVFVNRRSEDWVRLPLIQPIGDPSVPVSLFSAGMDSYLGLVQGIVQRSLGSQVVAASVVANSRLGELMPFIIRELRSTTGSEVIWPHIRPLIVGRGVRLSDREPTWRTRAFLFMSFGVVAARLSGALTLQVFENGVGAISLPLAEEFQGSMSGRTVHPRALALFRRLLDIVVDAPPGVENPFLWKTKCEAAELIQQAPQLRSLLYRTVSCDRAAYLRTGERCNACLQCVLRDIALHDERCETSAPFKRLNTRSLLHSSPAFTAISLQAERLRVILAASDPVSALLEEFPSVVDVAAAAGTFGCSTTLALERILDLYGRHIEQLTSLMSGHDPLLLAA